MQTTPTVTPEKRFCVLRRVVGLLSVLSLPSELDTTRVLSYEMSNDQDKANDLMDSDEEDEDFVYEPRISSHPALKFFFAQSRSRR